MPSTRTTLLSVAVLVVAATLAASIPTAGAEPPPTTYRPPVEAAVSDPFRAPTSPFGPGHRGLEYDTAPGTEVRAAAAGRVTFAGVVAGSRHVTVLHPDGLRTTASYLDEVAVVVGQEVAQGDVLGTTVGRLHFSARAGDGYLDPASLFVEGPPVVWLVPFDRPPGSGLAGERGAIRQLLGLGSGVLHLAGEAADWARDHGDDLLGLAWEYGPLVVPHLRTARLVLLGVDLLADAWEEAHRECTGNDVVVAPPVERRAAVLVGGLGSSSGNAAVDRVDVDALGYEPEDVVRFSYRGGRTPQSTGHPAGVEDHKYAGVDTRQDLRTSGEGLADLLEQVAAAQPGVPIDLIAHSQGGVVARLALIELQRRGRVGIVGSLATLGSPHQGADAATAVQRVGRTPGGDAALDLIGPLVDQDAGAPSSRQLSETSDLVAELARTPLPDGLPAVSIAARTDLVVPVPATRLDGARAVVIPITSPDAHTVLPGDPRTTRELALALAGAPPGCRSLGEALLDQAAGRAISVAEDALGLGLAGGTALATPVELAREHVDAALEGTRPPR